MCQIQPGLKLFVVPFDAETGKRGPCIVINSHNTFVRLCIQDLQLATRKPIECHK